MFLSLDYYGSSFFTTFYESIPGSGVDKDKSICLLLGITLPHLQDILSGKIEPHASICRLLYLESPYGRKNTQIDLHNEATLFARLSSSQEDTIKQLHKQIKSLLEENESLKKNSKTTFDSAANAPIFEAGRTRKILKIDRDFPEGMF